MRIALEPYVLVRELAARMEEKKLDPLFSRPWTTALKDCVRAMLQTVDGRTTEVLCSNSEDNKHEFLLDIVVWNREDGEGVILAVESEWLQRVSDIAEDFWKLLVIKSPVKLMIFASTRNARKHTQEAVQQELWACLQKYRDHHPGECYIFMDYAPPPLRRAWCVQIGPDGKLPPSSEVQDIAFQ